MKIEAVYDHGRLELPANVHLVRRRFLVSLDIPDDAIEPSAASSEPEAAPPQEVHPETKAVLARLRTIKEEMFALPDDQFPRLSEEQEGRVRAFGMREDR